MLTLLLIAGPESSADSEPSVSVSSIDINKEVNMLQCCFQSYINDLSKLLVCTTAPDLLSYACR